MKLKHNLSISKTAEKSDDFSSLTLAFKLTGLYDTFDKLGDFTVFAPTDKAFTQLPDGMMRELMKPENIPGLRALLGLHVMSGKRRVSELAAAELTENVLGTELQFEAGDKTWHVNQAQILEADIATRNGYLHVIDHVLLPPPKAEI